MPILNRMSVILQGVVNNVYPGLVSLASLSSHQHVTEDLEEEMTQRQTFLFGVR